MRKLCSNCGELLEDGELFCPKCGTRQMYVCNNCGIKFEKSKPCCPRCGTPVNKEVQQNVFNLVEPEEPISSTNGPGLAGLLLLLTSLLLFLTPVLPKAVLITLLIVCFVVGAVCTLIGINKRPSAVAAVSFTFYFLAILAIIVLVVLNIWFPKTFCFVDHFRL